MLSPSVLKRDNNLWSEMVYPGQELQIRVKDEEGEDPPSQTENKETQEGSPDIQINSPESETDSIKKENEAIPNSWKVYFCTGSGDIDGTLSFEGNHLLFSSNDSQSEANSEESQSKQKAIINIKDIVTCNLMIVPSTNVEDNFEATNEYDMDYLLQIILRNHGQRSMGKYLDSVFLEMKEKKTSYACIYLKINDKIDETSEYNNKQMHKMSHQIQRKIQEIQKELEEKEPEGEQFETTIPYCEFIFDNFRKTDAEILRKITRKETLAATLKKAKKNASNSKEEAKEGGTRPRGHTIKKVPKIVGESQILNIEQFTELIGYVSRLYQTLEWKLVYSTAVDGTSYQNLLRRTKYECPVIVVVKDENDFVFGAYCSREIVLSDGYYGNGETFLYTFRDLDVVTPFFWTKKNDLFLFIHEEGLTFGAKPHYGLWINKELTHGRSFECETFGNQQLSFKNDFQIMKLEIWGVIDPYATPPIEKINFSEL